MAGRKKFDDLRKEMSPERLRKNRVRTRKILAESRLARLREATGKTQVELAKAMGIKQPSLSRLENDDDMQIGTLRRIIEAMGGKMEIVAELPHGRVSLTQFSSK